MAFDINTFTSSVIDESNHLHRAEERPAALVVRCITEADHNGAFSGWELRDTYVAMLAYHLCIKEISKVADLRKVIEETQRSLADRPIRVLLLQGHGTEDTIQFGKSGKEAFYCSEDLHAETFGLLPKDCAIVFHACSTGKRLAQRVSEAVEQIVVAPTEDSPYSFWHFPYPLFFDRQGKLISRIFHRGQSLSLPSEQWVEQRMKDLALLGDQNAVRFLFNYYRLNRNETETAQWATPAIFAGDMTALSVRALEYAAEGSGALQQWGLRTLRDLYEIGHPNATAWLAQYYFSIGDFPNAFACTKRAVEDLKAPKEFFLATLYEFGIGTEKNPAKAKEYYNKGIRAHGVQALVALARQEIEMPGPRVAQGVSHFYIAAGLGNEDAIYSLAGLFLEGRGTARNVAKAVQCYQRLLSSPVYRSRAEQALFRLHPNF